MRRFAGIAVCAVVTVAAGCGSQAAPVREVTLPEGTQLSVKLDSTLASNASEAGESVRGALAESVTEDGTTVLPAGSVVTGVVTDAVRSGKVSGRASLGVRFTKAAVDGDDVAIDAAYSREAPGTKTGDAEKIGIGAGAGAVVGAIVGGKKGAAIGTAVGGGAGTATVLATSGDEVRWPAGTVLTVVLRHDVRVRVRPAN